MRILITGDLAITEPFDVLTAIDNNVKDLFNQSDINIVNLEAPITDSTSKSFKTGPNLKSHRHSTAVLFSELNIKIATLANNHLNDYGSQGIADTLVFCKEKKVQTVGGGMNIQEASKTLYIDSPEGRIGIVNFAENEWVAATNDTPGFNPMNLIDNSTQIREAKKSAKYVIVIVHGGCEYYKLPSPETQKRYRFYAEQGADLVVAHHTHYINGSETHNGVPIFYSLGNFIFPRLYQMEKEWYTGLILAMDISNNTIKSELIPVKLDTVKHYFSILESEDKKAVLNEIEELNEVISSPERIHENWNHFLQSKRNTYLRHWSPFAFYENRYVNALLRRTGLNFVNKTGLSSYLNLLRCEIHNEISNKILSDYIVKKLYKK